MILIARSVTRTAATTVATALVTAAIALLGGCGRGGDDDLWHQAFDASRPKTGTEVTGIWEGDVAMGGIRVRIDPDRMTIALRCDRQGRTVAQAAARIVVERSGPVRMVLQEDMVGGDAECGFRFMKGNEFAYALDPSGVLEIAFAGASVSRLTKLADLASR